MQIDLRMLRDRAAHRPCAVASLSSLDERFLVNICTEDRDLPAGNIGQKMAQQKCQGVRFLACSTACTPNTERVRIIGTAAGDQPGQYLTNQNIRVAKKVGFTNGKMVQQILPGEMGY